DQVKENAYLFTGKEFDSETNLYNFGARYYDPRTSIWENGDPLLSRLAQDDFRRIAASPYGYSLNRPTMLLDPDGEDWESFKKEFVAKATDIGGDLAARADGFGYGAQVGWHAFWEGATFGGY